MFVINRDRSDLDSIARAAKDITESSPSTQEGKELRALMIAVYQTAVKKFRHVLGSENPEEFLRGYFSFLIDSLQNNMRDVPTADIAMIKEKLEKLESGQELIVRFESDKKAQIEVIQNAARELTARITRRI